VVVYPWFYIIFVDCLFVSTLYVDFVEGGVGGVGEDFFWEDDNVVIVFLCFIVV